MAVVSRARRRDASPLLRDPPTTAFRSRRTRCSRERRPTTQTMDYALGETQRRAPHARAAVVGHAARCCRRACCIDARPRRGERAAAAVHARSRARVAANRDSADVVAVRIVDRHARRRRLTWCRGKRGSSGALEVRMVLRMIAAEWWFAPAPAERLAALRIVIGARRSTASRGCGGSSSRSRGCRPRIRAGRRRADLVRRCRRASIAIAAASVALLVAFVAGSRYRVIAPLAAARASVDDLVSQRVGHGVSHREPARAPRGRARVLPAADAWRSTRRRHAQTDYGGRSSCSARSRCART